MALIVGLTGRKRAGKDTVARLLALMLDGTPRKLAFADPIRDIGRIFGFSEHHMEVDKESVVEPWGVSWRKFAQHVGTDLFRKNFREDTWLTLMKLRIDKVLKEHDDAIILIPDVRFDNEAKLITEMGGVIVCVNRPDMVASTMDAHASEAGVSHYLVDSVLVNEEGLDKLIEPVIKLVHDLEKHHTISKCTESENTI